jgi:hypothetical protein
MIPVVGKRAAAITVMTGITLAAITLAIIRMPGPGRGGSEAGLATAQSPQPSVSAAAAQHPPAAARSGPSWLLTAGALQDVMADPVIHAGLPRTRVYELLQPGERPMRGVGALPVMTFPAVTALQDAISRGTLPAGTRAVLYDPEAWSYTPVSEQRDPVQAAARAAALAHAHGLLLIAAPALSLTGVLAPGDHAPGWRRFLDLGLAAGFAQVADVVELQAQSLERDSATYHAFVAAAAAQARTSNPRVSVVAGVSTNPPGTPVDSRQVITAVYLTQSVVNGYWLNIPYPSRHCPACNPPRPAIARQVLRAFL